MALRLGKTHHHVSEIVGLRLHVVCNAILRLGGGDQPCRQQVTRLAALLAHQGLQLRVQLRVRPRQVLDLQGSRTREVWRFGL